jgi:L-lactate dehydrogenase (cytochrome)
LRQRVLKEVGEVDLSTTLLGQSLAMPLALSPVGLTGMYAGAVKCRRRGRRKGWHPLHLVDGVGVPD